MRLLKLRNFAGASALRLVSIAFSLVSVPLLLQYLGAELYGTWVTLSSILMYAALLDLGIGSSLRNSIAGRSLSKNPRALQVELRSAFWVLAGVSAIAVGALSITVVARGSPNASAILFLYAPVAASVPFLLSSSILAGLGAFVSQSFFQSANVWFFICVVAVLAIVDGNASLLKLSAIWGISFFAFALFGFFYSLKKIGFDVKSTLSLRSGLEFNFSRFAVGGKFLLLQISVVFLYGLGNILTYNALGAREAARFDICNRIFQLGMSFYGIWIAIMWTEISKVRSTGDSRELRRVFIRMHQVALLFSLGVVCVAMLASNIVSVWTRNAVGLHWTDALPFAFQAIAQIFSYVGAVFLNAFEDILIQAVMSIFSIVLVIPIANLLFSKFSSFWVVPLASGLLTLIPMLVCNFRAVVRISSVGRGEAIA
ncbi:lipopolysaccharide biosynthesis protein [Pseudacidovorax intermedius]|uniref:lipopolysaccharide biosynthesis protein n=1 Tax=Pseudacidovorax intermedius TaxID=433924 RepID=UPI00128EDF79|nr:hypothetical protein [Pseudacidovorax intermedius]